MREVTGSKAYTFGYSPAAISIMSGRSAQENAGFFLPYLSPGMRVLDCGCGPGAITVGIGSAVAPGKVIGLDIEPSQIDLGRSEAAQQGGANVQFEVGDVEDLQFPDDSFDAVFGHTILMQFQDPTPMLREVFRVVKKGGVVGFREIDIGGSLYAPTGSALELLMKTFGRVLSHDGGDAFIGRRLSELMTAAGLKVLTADASYNCPKTPEQKFGAYGVMAKLWEEADFAETAERLGYIDGSERRNMVSRLRSEGNDPCSFYAAPYCEVVARKSDATP